MGFVILGLAALNSAGYNGAVFVMFSHGIVSAALFMCVGTLYLRTHTRMIAEYGGFASQTPIIFYFFLFMSMASLGLPLLISFAGESLVFYGAFLSDAFKEIALWGQTYLPWSIQALTIFSTIGIIIGAAYLLWMLYRVFWGALPEKWNKLPDATRSEVFVLGTLAVLVVLYGVWPQFITKHFEPETSQLAQPIEKSTTTHYVLSYVNKSGVAH
jgi:NADH-quinone oxidoreductase subunit M